MKEACALSHCVSITRCVAHRAEFIPVLLLHYPVSVKVERCNVVEPIVHIRELDDERWLGQPLLRVSATVNVVTQHLQDGH